MTSLYWLCVSVWQGLFVVSLYVYDAALVDVPLRLGYVHTSPSSVTLYLPRTGLSVIAYRVTRSYKKCSR